MCLWLLTCVLTLSSVGVSHTLEGVNVVPPSVQRRVLHNKAIKTKQEEAFRLFQKEHTLKPQRTRSKTCDASGQCVAAGLSGLLRENAGLQLCHNCDHVHDHGLLGAFS